MAPTSSLSYKRLGSYTKMANMLSKIHKLQANMTQLGSLMVTRFHRTYKKQLLYVNTIRTLIGKTLGHCRMLVTNVKILLVSYILNHCVR